MSIHYQRDGSIVLQSDADPLVTQTIPAGTAPDQVSGDIAAFFSQYPPPKPTQYAAADFINLFTDAEQQAIVAALPGNPALFIWYTKMLAAAVIDVTDPVTVAGINALVTGGLLTPARASQIEAIS
jgi:hypothetical protein